ncbi:Protein NDR1 [Apostasia shenzhenica]|uniref:Protein NDR1 n=1 Tax=Apostasia shenzhenica TaxID=1088818 RepID=A0A2H9ZZF6_9ASPA|nr:Protein NDR1 [Apostasia shenzhenica]
MSESGGLCQCCTKFVIAAGLTALALWLSFRPIKPRYYLVAFSLAASNSSSVASFQIEIENKNRQHGIYYDDIALSLLAGPNFSSPLSNSLINAFYQGHRKTADKDGHFSGNRSATAASLFRVAANSSYRYKALFWKSRHHAVSIAAEVEVDRGGKKTAEKGIRLTSSSGSGARALARRPVLPFVFLLYALIVLRR